MIGGCWRSSAPSSSSGSPANVASISIFALNLTTGLGLGLAIDYSLFIVSRYREEIATDGPGLAAMRRVMATAGRTVFFSSMTVAVALAALLVFPQRFLYSMGLGGSLVVLLAALISLTVLPAVLTLLGTRVNSLAPRFLQRRAEADTRPDEHGLLVPPLAPGDAPADPDRDAFRRLPDPPRASRSSGSSSTPSTRPSCRRAPAPARPTTRSAPSSRPTARPRSGSRSRARPGEGDGARWRRRIRHTEGVAEVSSPAAARATA